MAMGWWGVVLALAIPWLAGALWVRGGWRDPPSGIWPMALGYGYVLGMLAVTLLLRLQAALGLPLNFAGSAVVLALLLIVGGWWVWWRTSFLSRSIKKNNKEGMLEAGVKWPQILFVLLLAWLIWRFVLLAQEVWWQPLFPWDAWTTWAVRPRVWAELRELAPFVDPQRWLNDATGSVYTIDAWAYPYTVSLLALWPTLAFGAWNETAANLPWLGVALALGLGFYGQARWWGATPLVALIFTWLMLSLPLLDTHVALAGYADLWLASVFGLAVIAFFQWARDGDRWQGGLALLLALACSSIKLEGTVWILLFVPALLAARLPGWLLLALGSLAVALGLGWWLAGGVTFAIPGLGDFLLKPDLIQVPYLGRLALSYHNSWDPVLRNFFVLANWHLFWYLALIAAGVTVTVMVRRGAERWLWAEFTFLIASLLALFVLFFLTDAQRWAEQYTSINRLSMHFIPALLFWIMTVFVGPHRRQLSSHRAERGESSDVRLLPPAS